MAEPSEAAVAVATQMATELVEKIPAPAGEDDRLRADLATVVEAPAIVSSQEEVVAPPEGEHETTPQEAVPSYEVEVPDELLAELDEPDFEAEADEELAEPDPEDQYEGYEDETKRRIAAEKRAKWLEDRLVQQNRAKWEAEALRYFPLSEHRLKGIEANSRRAFLRQARSAHDEILPYVKPLLEELEEAKQAAKAAGKQEAAAAWGKPTTGPGVVPVTTSQVASELEEARRSGNLAKVIGVMRRQATGAKE